MLNDGFERYAIIEGSVCPQALWPATHTESALELLAFAGAIDGTKHGQRIDVDPAGHRSRAQACTYAFTQQKREVELQSIMRNHCHF